MGSRGPAPGTRPSGRALGAPNLRTVKLYERICERVNRYPYLAEDGGEYNPIIELAKIGMERDPLRPKEFRYPVDVRIACHKEVAQYLFPKRAAVQITDDTGDKSLEKREAMVNKLLDTLQGKILDVTPVEVDVPGDQR